MAHRFAFGLALALLTGGCLTLAPGDADDPLPDAPRVVGAPIVQDHDHGDPALHALGFNTREVGFVTAWGDGTGFGAGGVNEIAVQGPYAYLSRSNPEGGFVVVDVADPANPRLISEWLAEGGADLEVAADGNFVFFTTQRTVPGEQTPSHVQGPAPRGIYVVDVHDKERPRLESFTPLPVNGPHTATYHRLGDGREVIVVCTYDLNSTPGSPVSVPVGGTNPATQRVFIYEFVEEGGRHVLSPLSQYSRTPPPGGALTWRPHDAHVEEHPLTGELLLYLAYWDGGLVILDVTDLSNPVEVSQVTDFAPSSIVQLHEVRTFPTLIDGLHVTAVAPEIPTAEETGQVTFLDTTDPANPKKLGHWSLPGDLIVDEPFIFSPHNFVIDEGGLLYIGHNHAGVWVIDASTREKLMDPQAIAYHLPHGTREGASPAPSVWGVRVQDGLVYVSDGPTGLHVIELVQRPGSASTPPGHLPGGGDR